MANATTTARGFSISGKFITDLAREYVLDGKHQQALSFLVDSLAGMSVEQAVGILSGKQKLIGDSRTNDVDLVDEDKDCPDAQAYLASVERMWRGMFKFENKYFKVHSKVVAWSRDDYHFSLEVGRHVHTTGDARLKLVRSAYYAPNPEKDLIVGSAGGIFICERISHEPPFWVKVPHTISAEFFIMEYTKKHPVAEIGADLNTYSPQQVSRNTALPEPMAVVQNPRKASNEERELDEAEEIARQVQEQARRAAYAQAIKAQATAGAGFFDLKVTSEDNPQASYLVQVPRAPFMHWAFHGVDVARFGIELPDWKTVCPVGLKMSNDSPYHSDWMLGAGLDLERDSYGSLVQTCAFSAMHTMREEALQSNCTVLSGKGVVYGEIVFPLPGERVAVGAIAVVPFASPDYQAAMESACVDGRGAVLCETGGKLAHLAIVGREMQARVVMQPSAMSRYKTGDHVTIDCQANVILSHCYE